MMHLTEDQLYHLAELSCDAEELNTEETWAATALFAMFVVSSRTYPATET